MGFAFLHLERVDGTREKCSKAIRLAGCGERENQASVSFGSSSAPKGPWHGVPQGLPSEAGGGDGMYVS